VFINFLTAKSQFTTKPLIPLTSMPTTTQNARDVTTVTFGNLLKRSTPPLAPPQPPNTLLAFVRSASLQLKAALNAQLTVSVCSVITSILSLPLALSACPILLIVNFLQATIRETTRRTDLNVLCVRKDTLRMRMENAHCAKMKFKVALLALATWYAQSVLTACSQTLQALPASFPSKTVWSISQKVFLR